MPSIRQRLVLSRHPAAGFARSAYRALNRFTMPAPKVIVKPMLGAFLAVRWVYFGFLRLFICEPLFKAYCERYGRGVRTDVHIHWVQGKGAIVLGDDVLIDGKCSFSFAARFADRPTLTIGDHTGIGHGCAFTIGKRISIGRHCRIASEVIFFDSSGHPSEPSARLAGSPPGDDEVRPIQVGDNVWIGNRCIIFPGVTIGEGSVVSAGAVVMGDVPPYTIVAGNPARKVAALKPAGVAAIPTASG